jgi:hypothetical protein
VFPFIGHGNPDNNLKSPCRLFSRKSHFIKIQILSPQFLDGCFIPRRTDRLAVGRNIRLRLRLFGFFLACLQRKITNMLPPVCLSVRTLWTTTRIFIILVQDTEEFCWNLSTCSNCGYSWTTIRTVSNSIFIFLWLYSPFVEPWRLFQFLNPIHSRYDSLGGRSARRKAPTCTQVSTNTE